MKRLGRETMGDRDEVTINRRVADEVMRDRKRQQELRKLDAEEIEKLRKKLTASEKENKEMRALMIEFTQGVRFKAKLRNGKKVIQYKDESEERYEIQTEFFTAFLKKHGVLDDCIRYMRELEENTRELEPPLVEGSTPDLSLVKQMQSQVVLGVFERKQEEYEKWERRLKREEAEIKAKSELVRQRYQALRAAVRDKHIALMERQLQRLEEMYASAWRYDVNQAMKGQVDEESESMATPPHWPLPPSNNGEDTVMASLPSVAGEEITITSSPQPVIGGSTPPTRTVIIGETTTPTTPTLFEEKNGTAMTSSLFDAAKPEGRLRNDSSDEGNASGEGNSQTEVEEDSRSSENDAFCIDVDVADDDIRY